MNAQQAAEKTGHWRRLRVEHQSIPAILAIARPPRDRAETFSDSPW
jgi:hypothetical protein